MMRTGNEREQGLRRASDRLLWQRGRETDVPQNEAAHFLDLAAFADRLLDADEQDRVAAVLAANPDAAADVAAARALGAADQGSAELERIVLRACALQHDTMLADAAPKLGSVVALAPRLKRRRMIYDVAHWGSIAAALAVASWLGFSMGTHTSLALTEPRQAGEATLLPELSDPPSGLLRELGEGLRT
jgi:cytochrome c5